MSGLQWNYDSANKLNWANSCDFALNDLSNVLTSSDRCGPICRSTSGCTHFTWTNYLGGTCWMKKGTISKDNAKQVQDSSFVCGVLDQSTGIFSFHFKVS